MAVRTVGSVDMNDSLSRKDLRIPVLTILRTKFFQVKNGKKKKNYKAINRRLTSHISHTIPLIFLFFLVLCSLHQ